MATDVYSLLVKRLANPERAWVVHSNQEGKSAASCTAFATLGISGRPGAVAWRRTGLPRAAPGIRG
jgi:hypothetical protein